MRVGICPLLQVAKLGRGEQDLAQCFPRLLLILGIVEELFHARHFAVAWVAAESESDRVGYPPGGRIFDRTDARCQGFGLT